MLGNLLSYGQHGYVRSARLSSDEFWHGAAEAIYRVRRAEKLDGSADIQLIKDLEGESLAEAAGGLYDFGYREAEAEPSMVLAIDPAWTSYADYLASLAANTAKTSRRASSILSKARYRIAQVADPSELAPRLHELTCRCTRERICAPSPCRNPIGGRFRRPSASGCG